MKPCYNRIELKMPMLAECPNADASQITTHHHPRKPDPRDHLHKPLRFRDAVRAPPPPSRYR